MKGKALHMALDLLHCQGGSGTLRSSVFLIFWLESNAVYAIIVHRCEAERMHYVRRSF